MPVNTDGEIVTSTPARVVIHPSAVAVFAPRVSTLPRKVPEAA